MKQRVFVRRLLVLGIAVAVLLLALRPGGIGAQGPATASLETGWNNIAYGGETLPVVEALTGARGSVDSVWQWRAPAQEWVVAFIGSNAPASLQSLATGSAYWIRATAPVLWQWRAEILFQTAQLAIDRAAAVTLSIDIEIADTGARRSRGLMFRETLAQDTGMLFLFPADTTGGFWMRDTLLPLSIAFIGSDGRIQEIRDMQPLDETLVAPAEPYRWALEVNQGWFAANAIAVGDLVRLTGS